MARLGGGRAKLAARVPLWRPSGASDTLERLWFFPSLAETSPQDFLIDCGRVETRLTDYEPRIMKRPWCAALPRNVDIPKAMNARHDSEIFT